MFSHYYQTLWFYFLEGSLVLGLGFVAYQLRVRQVTARLDSQFRNDFRANAHRPGFARHAFAGVPQRLHAASRCQ